MPGAGLIADKAPDMSRRSSRLRSITPRVSRARIFSSGPSNAAALAADRTLAGLAVAHGAAASARRARAKAIWRRSGRASRRADLVAARARRRRRAGRARDRRAGGRGSGRGPLRRSARCFICSILRARSAPMSCITARTAPAGWRIAGAPISPRGCARCRW